MSGLSRGEWRISREVIDQLRAETALTAADLADRLHVSEGDLKAPIGMLLGRGLIVRCDAYLTLPLADRARP